MARVSLYLDKDTAKKLTKAAKQAIGPLDTLIAATALVNNATLVTHNTREFGRVPGLSVEDWY